MCTEEFIRMMFTVDLYGNRGLDSRTLYRWFLGLNLAENGSLLS